jgi:hypothetical protein
MKRILFILAFVIPTILISGCSQKIADLTIVSTKNVDVGTNYVKVKSDAEGSNMAHIIIIFPIGAPNIESAIDDVLDKNNGDIIINARLEYQTFYIPYIYGQNKYVIKGDIYKKAEKLRSMSSEEINAKAAKDIENTQEYYYVSTENNKLNITKISKDKVALDPKTSKIFVKQ